jgi:hypothetical protein
MHAIAAAAVGVGSSGLSNIRVHVCTLSSRRVSQSTGSMRRAVRATQLEFVCAE